MQLLYKTARFPEQGIKKTSELLLPLVKHYQEIARNNSYSTPESFINLPFDEKQANEVFAVNNLMVNQHLKYVIVVGIGGSGLGTKAVYEALQGYYLPLELEHYPRMLFMDTIDPEFREHLETLLKKEISDPEEILIVVVSESGTTIETRNNLDFLLHAFPDFRDRMVTITDFDSPLWKEYCKNPERCLTVPQKISGRYSVFSSVGLFPLSTVGINILGLMEGAMGARKNGLSEDIWENKAMLVAALSYLAYSKGLTTHVNFVFHPKLESLGKWWVQLTAESLGKEGKGITPLVSVGTNDLHSLVQLYLDGPNDKFYNFIRSESDLSGETKAILEGVKKSFEEHKKPFIETVLENTSEKSLGYYIQVTLMTTVFIAKLMGVTPFGQPAVEDYKRYARDILTK